MLNSEGRKNINLIRWYIRHIEFYYGFRSFLVTILLPLCVPMHSKDLFLRNRVRRIEKNYRHRIPPTHLIRYIHTYAQIHPHTEPCSYFSSVTESMHWLREKERDRDEGEEKFRSTINRIWKIAKINSWKCSLICFVQKPLVLFPSLYSLSYWLEWKFFFTFQLLSF